MQKHANRIDSVLQNVIDLRKSSCRNRHKLFVVEGARFLHQAIAHHAEIRSVIWAPSITKNPKIVNAILRLKILGVECIEVDASDYFAVSDANEPDGIIAIIVQRWTTLSKSENDGIYLAVEDIQSPGNLGSIIRTAAAAGLRGLIALRSEVDVYEQNCVRATMGAIFCMQYFRSSLQELNAWAQTSRMSIIGTSPQAKSTIYQTSFENPMVILVGSERTGLSADATRICTKLTRIPMKSGIDSLNVSVATGIVVFHAVNSATS